MESFEQQVNYSSLKRTKQPLNKVQKMTGVAIFSEECYALKELFLFGVKNSLRLTFRLDDH